MINIYCDESCHLEHDNSDIMVLGAMSCNFEEKTKIFNDIRKIKMDHELSSKFEIKWTKVSKSKIEFYKKLVDYFFENNNLWFRGIVARHKKDLNNDKYNNGDYNTWYYKMYFRLLEPIIYETENYKIFIDIKDTHGGPRVRKLHKVLCNNKYDFKSEVIQGVYQINSKESEILQLTDLMIGALSYYNRGLYENGLNDGKKELINYIQTKFQVNLKCTTDRSAKKINLFIWDPEGWR